MVVSLQIPRLPKQTSTSLPRCGEMSRRGVRSILRMRVMDQCARSYWDKYLVWSRRRDTWYICTWKQLERAAYGRPRQVSPTQGFNPTSQPMQVQFDASLHHVPAHHQQLLQTSCWTPQLHSRIEMQGSPNACWRAQGYRNRTPYYGSNGMIIRADCPIF